MIGRSGRPGGLIGGAMFAAGPRRQHGAGGGQGYGFPAGWSWLQGKMAGGAQALPPGIRVPGIQDALRRPQAPMPAPAGAPPAGLDAAMGLGAPQGAPAAPAPTAAPGQGIPPGMPPPDAGGPPRPTGGPLMAAMLGPTSSPQAYLQRAGYGVG